MMDVALMVAASSGPLATRRRSKFFCIFIGTFISLLAVLALFTAAQAALFVSPAEAVPVVVTPPHAPPPLTTQVKGDAHCPARGGIPQLAAHPGRAGVHSPATTGPSARPLPAAPFESATAGLCCAAGFGTFGAVIKFLWGDVRHVPASGPWRLTAMAAKPAAVKRSFEDVEQDPIVVAAKYNYRGRVLLARAEVKKARAEVVKQNTDPVKEILIKIARFVAKLTALKMLGWSLGTLMGVAGLVYGIHRGLQYFFLDVPSDHLT
jgi:hypothetical protein